LPRDIWDTDTQDKINATYTYALAQKEVDPYTYTRLKFERITGIQIDHILIINFEAFAKAIDIVGGIEVQNDVAFTDAQYPIAGLENKDCIPFDVNYGCRYESVSFLKGPIQMSGPHALKFVRSRHAVGDEGTDFARSHRQQLVLSAVAQKITKLITSIQLEPLTDLVEYLNSHISRTLSNKDALGYLFDIVVHRNSFHLSHLKMAEDLLIVPPPAEYDGRYVLVPKDKKDSTLSAEIQKLLQ
jgi:anionic cell wall polymer biosynthesis LytR-Cps2A-Psr (LCP) family protein